jgi:hypothetical protein
VLNVAVPPDKVRVPRAVAPSINVTVPPGVPTPLVGVTVAVKVTELPYADGLADDETAVDVVDRPTLKVPVAKLERKTLCVGYDASKEWLPELGLDIVKVAEPLVSGLTTAVPLSTLKDTLPVGVIPVPLAATDTVTLPSTPNAIAGAVIVVCVAAIRVVKFHI